MITHSQMALFLPLADTVKNDDAPPRLPAPTEASMIAAQKQALAAQDDCIVQSIRKQMYDDVKKGKDHTTVQPGEFWRCGVDMIHDMERYMKMAAPGMSVSCPPVREEGVIFKRMIVSKCSITWGHEPDPHE